MASSRTHTPSASDSDNSATRSPLPKDAGTDNAVHEVFEKKPALINPFEDMNSKETIEKFQKYEADYTRYLKAKYFSDKDIFGGNIFDEKVAIDGHTIKASRWPGTKSYADPASFEDQNSGGSPSIAETPSTLNGKSSAKKSG